MNLLSNVRLAILVRSFRRRAFLAAIGLMVSAVLMANDGAVPPAVASAQASEPAVLGGFALGDGIEGLVDARTGALSFSVPVAGLAVGWDSQASSDDRSGLGGGWTFAGLAQVAIEGGVRVVPSSGGVYQADASVPSGLSGYVLGDVAFVQGAALVPARPDGLRGAHEASYELEELGGIRTYFSADGDPVIRVDANGHRTDWEWVPGHRLVRVTDPVGVVTVLDWSDPGRVQVTTGSDGSGQVTAAIELDGGRVSAVVDATGGRLQLGYSPAGLIDRITGVLGASTELSWQRLVDGRATVERIRVVDAATGAELSTRRWEASTGLASGWPAHAGGAEHVAGDEGAHYVTAVSDGATTVASEFTSTHLLIDRRVEITTPAGTRTVQKQAYTYPEPGPEGVLPPQYSRPTAVSVTHFSASGAQREATESYESDELGRLVTQIAEDGTTSETSYDEVVADGSRLPIGLLATQRVTAPDGLVAETRHELNPARTAYLATETFTGRAVDDELTRTGRQEFEVEPDGFVSQERAFPQGGAGTPVVTVHGKDTDLVEGNVLMTTTLAAGTGSEATSTRVLDLLHGVPIQETGPAGTHVSAVYDAAGRPVEQVDPAGNRTRIEYRTLQQHGQNATIVTGPDGVVTTMSTDVLGRVVQIADNIRDGVATPGHVRVAETRSPLTPGVLAVTDAWGATTTTEQDVYGRTVETVAQNGLTELTIHDDVANTVTTALTPTGDFAGAATTATARMDTSGRATERTGTRADGTPVPTVTTAFDGLGRVTETADGASTTTIGLDPFGNPTTTTVTPEPGTVASGAGAAPMTATREFDEFGTSTVKTLATQDEARQGGVLTHDELGRVRSRVDQTGGSTTHEYTPDGLVASTVTSYGQVTRNEYHAETRALIRTDTRSPVGATVATGYDYDRVTGNLVAVFDPGDRPGTQVQYEYDAWGNVTRTTYPDGATVEHGYDAHGRLDATTDVAGNVTRYRYDAVGLVTTATQTDQRHTVVAEVGYRYDAYGRLIEQARNNGVSTNYAYTSASQVAGETATRPDGTTLTDRAYEYDDRGNLTNRVDTRPHPETGSPVTTTTAYRYDAFDRLIDSTVHDGAGTDAPVRTATRYELTVAGDIRAEHVTRNPGAPTEGTTTRTFEYGPTGSLTSVATTHPDGTVTTATQEYDEAGNLTRSLDGRGYTYNAVNRPVTETTPGATSIHTRYWATGQPAAQTQADASVSTVFHWDGGALINDSHTTGGPDSSPAIASYLIGVGRHARTTAGTGSGAGTGTGTGTEASTVYYEADSHGNITELTGHSAAIVTSYDYTDYGIATTRHHAGDERPAGSVVGNLHRNPFQYAGEYTNPTGTQHLQTRTYDPGSMRMTSVDPAPLHNRYHYAGLNPITFADPTGRVPALPTWAGAVLAGAGLLLAAFGLVGAIGAYMTATATAVAGTAPILTKLVLGAVIVASVYDLTATVMTTVDEFVDEFLDDEIAFALGAASAAAGVATVPTGWVTRAFGRADVGSLVARGARESDAQKIVRVEEIITKKARKHFDALRAHFTGIPATPGLTSEALQATLHRNIRAKNLNADGTWNASQHLNSLNDILLTPGVPAVSARNLRLRVDADLWEELALLRKAERYGVHMRSPAVDGVLNDVRARLIPKINAIPLHIGSDTSFAYRQGNSALGDAGFDLTNEFGQVAYSDPNRTLNRLWTDLFRSEM